MSKYDEIWDKKADNLFRASFLKKEIALFAENKIRKVLDLGCGDGRNLLKLASIGYEMTGLDYSRSAIDMTRRNAQAKGLDVSLVKHDFYLPLPFEDSSFCAVYAYQSLCHNRLGKILDVFREIHRVLRKDGLFSIKAGIDRKFLKRGEFYYMFPRLTRKLKMVEKRTFLPIDPKDPELGIVHYEFTMKKLVFEVEKAGFLLIDKRRLKRGTMGILNFRKA